MIPQLLSNEGVQAALVISVIFIGLAVMVLGSFFFQYLSDRSKDKIRIEQERTKQLELQLKIKEKNKPQPKDATYGYSSGYQEMMQQEQ